MKIPSSIGHDEATQLIVDCDAAFIAGVAKTNRVGPIKKCNKCGVRFASQSFTYCPICASRKVNWNNGPKYPRHSANNNLTNCPVEKTEQRTWVHNTVIVVLCLSGWMLLGVIANAVL